MSGQNIEQPGSCLFQCTQATDHILANAVVVPTTGRLLKPQRGALEKERSLWEKQRGQSELQLTKRSQQLDVRQTELDALKRELDDHRQQFEMHKHKWQSEREASQERLDESYKEIEARWSELESQCEHFDGTPQHWEANNATIKAEQVDPAVVFSTSYQSETQEVAVPASVDHRVLLGRVKAAGVKPDEDRESHSQHPSALAVVAAIEENVLCTDSVGLMEVNSSPDSESSEQDEYEESIKQYMERLMKRERSIKESSPRQQRTSIFPTPHAPDRLMHDASIHAQVSSQSARLVRETLQLVPRAVALEKHSCLPAMGELANLSAKHAIFQHTRRRTLKIVRSKLITALVALTAGVALMWMWMSFDGGALALSRALAAFFVSALWCFWSVITFSRLVRKKSK